MNISVTTIAATFASSLLLASAGLAETHPRILSVSKNACASFVDDLKDWAGSMDGHAAYAVPVAPASLNYSCDNPGPTVPTGFSYGFDKQALADKVALDECEARLPDGYSRCIVVGRSRPQ